MTGSYFIQALVHVFKNQAHEKSFMDLMEEVTYCKTVIFYINRKMMVL